MRREVWQKTFDFRSVQSFGNECLSDQSTEVERLPCRSDPERAPCDPSGVRTSVHRMAAYAERDRPCRVPYFPERRTGTPNFPGLVHVSLSQDKVVVKR
jgi:hypothetical protein